MGAAWRGVFAVPGNPLEREYLLQAMITKAHSAIILADEESPNPDTTNFMLAASIEQLNPHVHTVVETAYWYVLTVEHKGVPYATGLTAGPGPARRGKKKRKGEVILEARPVIRNR